MYLFFDTETTGLPRDWKAPVTDLSNWPRLVQLAWLLYESDGRLLSEGNYIIRPNGFTIPKAASSIHGITTEKALAHGVKLETVMQEFMNQLKASTHLIAHNMSFDENIVGSEMLRMGMPNLLTTKRKVCTMKESTQFCNIDGYYEKMGKKWPKLTELHYKVFEEDFEGAHDAATDIRITAKCFWELRRRRILFHAI